MEILVGVVGGVILVLGVLRLVRWLRERRRRFVSRWATRNGYSTRRDNKVHLFVQGPPFDRGDGIIERALLVGGCADRPALITYFSWYYGNPRRVAGSCLALVLELPGSVPPMQIEPRPDRVELPRGELGIEDLYRAYHIECDVPDFVGDVLNRHMIHFLLTGPRPDRVNIRLDGTALVVSSDGELTTGSQLSALHDFTTEFYRLIPTSVFDAVFDKAVGKAAGRVAGKTTGNATGTAATSRDGRHAPDDRPAVLGAGRALDIHGRRGEVHQQDDEVFVSLPVEAAWPQLSIVAYELLADQYRATVFDKPGPSAHPLIDVMFAVRSVDENFRRMVLADLADWLPIDHRTRRCAIRLDLVLDHTEPGRESCVGLITAHAPGADSNPALVELLADVVHEVSRRLSADTYRHRVARLPASTTIKALGQQA